jgi:hypothetical protein
MVPIPAGIFLMGSRAAEGSPEEHPMHEVAVAAFLIDRAEVTVADYAACIRAGACTPQRGPHPLCNPPDAGRDSHPVNCVDHGQADAYCRFAGKRLPSEREWEYAARGGSELRRFSWGEEPPDGQRACYDHIGTCPAGSFPPGAFGLLDMSGNVWEWTSTWFGRYPDEPEAGTHRVYRGGSFSRRFPKWLRNAIRNRYEPEAWSASLGIRCARTIKPVQCPEDTAPREPRRPELPPACARVRGTPACEPGYAWNGARCVLEVPGQALRATTHAEVSTAPPPTAPLDTEDAPRLSPVVRSRTPEHDEDCRKHYPTVPAAYRFSGGTFHGRNPAIAAAGCVRRDMGESWTSACCPE